MTPAFAAPIALLAKAEVTDLVILVAVGIAMAISYFVQKAKMAASKPGSQPREAKPASARDRRAQAPAEPRPLGRMIDDFLDEARRAAGEVPAPQRPRATSRAPEAAPREEEEEEEADEARVSARRAERFAQMERQMRAEGAEAAARSTVAAAGGVPLRPEFAHMSPAEVRRAIVVAEILGRPKGGGSSLV
ncbi:MAG: hypothetical protein HY719_02400 [Planctomycetes bacterium]|nr:hypothetical protein [Planctomycetota bacterium]